MKRFQINFPVNGQETPLFVEAMDDNHTRFSIERQENDPHPLLIELDKDDLWHIKSQDAWSLSDEEINNLGCLVGDQCDSSKHLATGINAT